jgi:hypothetical protein
LNGGKKDCDDGGPDCDPEAARKKLNPGSCRKMIKGLVEDQNWTGYSCKKIDFYPLFSLTFFDCLFGIS